ncbi:hypothetical protein BYT27DRAFT_7085341, partial [Phlegmacium glaucopus]
WCSSCRNGGMLVLCIFCKTNAVCTECIDFKFDEDVPSSIDFQCPSCFLKNDKFGIYPFKFSSSTSTRQHWPQVLTTPLAIISIYLEGMKDTPSIITYHHLHPWLQGNLVHIDFDFNFENSTNDFNIRLNRMLDRFENGDLKDWSRFFIFIMTHSDPKTGYVHIAPNNTGSVPVGELLPVIFSPRFQHILHRSNSNILNLLSCGALSTREDSKAAVQDFADTNLFSKILCFSQADFQPSFTHGFVMDIGLHLFIYNRIKLDHILQEQQELGAHTNIVEFQPGKTLTFMWTHPGARPMGVGVSNQCFRCNRLKTMKPTSNQLNSEITLQCTICNFSKIFYFPSGWKWICGPPTRGDARGAWMVFTDVRKDENWMDTA